VTQSDRYRQPEPAQWGTRTDPYPRKIVHPTVPRRGTDAHPSPRS